jgi:gliding motility-associated-like protein
MRFYLSLLFLLIFSASKAQVVINEYSCSNLSTQADNYGDYEDWIEFYNPTGAAIDLTGYHLSDKASNPTKWQFPGGTVPPGGFLLVICSGRSEVSGGFVHAGIKLTQTKPEELVFANPSGTVLETYTLSPTQSGHSRGRTTDAAPTWSLYTTPTPNASNSSPKQEYTARPVMSQPQGFYNGTISVSISTTDPLATIYYTLDGSTPTASSTVYSTPISVAATTVVRARSFSSNPNVPASFVESNTYFINVNHTIPVMSIFGDEVETLFNGSQLDPDATVEYFDKNKVFKTEATGTSNKHGNDSWAYDQRGIDFVAQDQKGYNYALEHKIFARKDRDKFQKVIIKAAANDNYPFETGGAHIRDAYIATISHDGDLHLDERTYEPMILYVNGQYWGVYEIREKVDDHDFTGYYYDQDEFNLQYLKTWGGTWSEYGGAQAQTDWNALRTFITTQDMTIQSNYDYVDSLFNTKSLVDYFVLNSYVVCMDWLNWNTAWWRGMDPDGDKKKWRYTLWDMDATFGHYVNYTGIPDETAGADPCDPEGLSNPGGQGHTDILTDLMANPTFEQYYITRWIDLSNTVFSCASLIAKLDSLIAIIDPEMPAQIAKWGGNYATWQTNVNTLRTFIQDRCAQLDAGLIDCYNLNGPYTITVQADPPGSGYVMMNSLTLNNLPWTGTAFGGIPNLFAAVPYSGFVFDYWEMSSNTALPSTEDSAMTVDFVASDVIIAHFKPPQTIFIPTAFSPNGDGVNDELEIMGEGIVSINFAIYDRWGQRVFSSTNPTVTWNGTFDGKQLNSGVYAYKLYAVLLDGEIVEKSGNITLMR